MLDYAQVLSRLVELQGEEVDVGVSATHGPAPQVAYLMGRLTTSDAYGGHIVGYHPDAFVLSIGHAGRITLHPDQFTGGEWGVDDTSRMLTVTMGAVTVHVRAGR